MPLMGVILGARGRESLCLFAICYFYEGFKENDLYHSENGLFCGVLRMLVRLTSPFFCLRTTP